MNNFFYFLIILFFIAVFMIPYMFLYIDYTKSYKTKDESELEDICFAFFFVVIIYIIVYAVLLFFNLDSHFIEFLYRIKDTRTILFSIISFLVFLIPYIICTYKLKTSSAYKSNKRKEVILKKLAQVKADIRYFDKYCYDYSSAEQKASIKNTLKLLRQIKNELELSSIALDINDISTTYKDVPLESSSLEEVQMQVDKMKSYRSLSEISNDLDSLMKNMIKRNN